MRAKKSIRILCMQLFVLAVVLLGAATYAQPLPARRPAAQLTDALAQRLDGAHVWDTTNSKLMVSDGNTWLDVQAGLSGGGAIVVYDTDTNTVNNYQLGGTEATRRTAFNNAVTALTDGDIIVIPRGQYDIADTTVTEDNLTWIQHGKLFTDSSSVTHLLTFSGNDNLIRGMWIEGNSTAGDSILLRITGNRNYVDGFKCLAGPNSAGQDNYPILDNGTDTYMSNVVIRSTNGPIRMNGRNGTLDGFHISNFAGTHAISSGLSNLNIENMRCSLTVINGKIIHDSTADPNNAGAINMSVMEKTATSITDVSAATPPVVTSTAHGLLTGHRVKITGITGSAGMTALNDKWYTVTYITDDTFSLDGQDTMGESYTSGGSVGFASHIRKIVVRNIDIDRPDPTTADTSNVFIKVQNTDTIIIDNIKVQQGSAAAAEAGNPIQISIDQQDNEAEYSINNWTISNSYLQTVLRGGSPIKRLTLDNVICDLDKTTQTRFITGMTGIDSFEVRNVQTRNAGSDTLFHFTTLPAGGIVIDGLRYDGTGSIFAGMADSGKDISSFRSINDVVITTATGEIVQNNTARDLLMRAAQGDIVDLDLPIRSVLAFGADHTGNDVAETKIQAAIDDLPAMGGSIYVPSGTYLIGAKITIPSNVTFFGDARGSSIIQCAQDGYGGHLVEVQASATNVTIRDLTLREASSNPRTAPTGSDGACVFVGDNCTDIKVERCNFDGLFYGFETSATGVSRVTVSDCYAINARNWGIGLTNATECIFHNCTARDNGLDGFKLRTNCTGLRMSQCDGSFNGDRAEAQEAATNGNGIDLFGGGEKLHITNSVFNNNWGAGILIKVGDATDRTEITISDCTANDNQIVDDGMTQIPSNGLDYAAASQIPVHHIHVKNCQFNRNTHNGIDLTGARNSTFSGITCKSNQDDGVFVSVGYDLVFDSMQIEGNEDYGFRVDFLERSTIQNSTINGSTDDTFTGDPADMTTTKETDYGIRVLANSSENKIINCNFYRPAFRDIWSQAADTLIEKCTFVKPLSGAILIDTNNDNIVRYCRFLDHDGNSATVGAVTVSSGTGHIIEKNYFRQNTAEASRPAIYLAGGSAYCNRNRIINYPTDGGYHNNTGKDLFLTPINPLDYDADPTGAADSKSAIGEADAAAAMGNSHLEFSYGTYKVSSALTIARNCEFFNDSKIKPDSAIDVQFDGSTKALHDPLDVSAGGTFTIGATGGPVNDYQRRTTLASGNDLFLAEINESYINITGTTTINTLGDCEAGIIKHLHFSGVLTLTHNATNLILPTATNITTAADDTCLAVSETGANQWRIINYQKADGTALSGGGGGDNLGNHTATQIIDAVTFGIQFSEANQDIIGSASGIVYDSPTGDIHDWHINGTQEYSMNLSELILRDGNRLQLEDGDGMEHVNITAPSAISANYTVTMPSAGPSGPNEILESDGSGNLSWIATPGGGGGAFSADAQTQITPTTAIVLDEATGNEIALDIPYTVNKATSGNDTGLRINMTDTASPGTSLLIDAQVGGTSLFNIDLDGTIRGSYGPGGVTTNFVAGDGAGAALTTGSNNVIIGKDGAANISTGLQNVMIGAMTTGTANNRAESIMVGYNANAHTRAVAVGKDADASGLESVAVGQGAIAAQSTAIAIGHTSTTTSANQLVIGADGAAINDVYFGKGVTNTTPTNYAINGTGGSGTDIAGADITIAGGKGTGSGVGGDVVLQYAETGAAATTLNNLNNLKTLRGRKVNTTDATITTCGTFDLATDTVYHVTATILARETTASSDVASYVRKATVKNDGGVSALVGSVTPDHTAETVGGWDATIDVDDTTDVVRIRVTGAAATDIDWQATIEVFSLSP